MSERAGAQIQESRRRRRQCLRVSSQLQTWLRRGATWIQVNWITWLPAFMCQSLHLCTMYWAPLKHLDAILQPHHNESSLLSWSRVRWTQATQSFDCDQRVATTGYKEYALRLLAGRLWAMLLGMLAPLSHITVISARSDGNPEGHTRESPL